MAGDAPSPDVRAALAETYEVAAKAAAAAAAPSAWERGLQRLLGVTLPPGPSQPLIIDGPYAPLDTLAPVTAAVLRARLWIEEWPAPSPDHGAVPRMRVRLCRRDRTLEYWEAREAARRCLASVPRGWGERVPLP